MQCGLQIKNSQYLASGSTQYFTRWCTLSLRAILLVKILTSGQSNLTWDHIAEADRRFNRIHQVAPMCRPMWAHWRQLANTIELMLPSAHPSPQPKRSAVSAQLMAESPYTLQWVTLSPRIAPCYGGSGSPSNSWFLWWVQACNPNVISRFRTGDRRVSVYFTIGHPFSLKIAPSHGEIWTPTQYMIPWGHPSPQSKRHLSQFSHFCGAH